MTAIAWSQVMQGSFVTKTIRKRKLGFQFLVFKQQCKASIEQFLYLLNMLLKDNMNRLIRITYTVGKQQHDTGQAR